MGTAGSGGGPIDVSNVFSTFLYTGNGSTQTITNNIDLDGEGGLVWTKNREQSAEVGDDFYFTDTARGVGKVLDTARNSAQAADADTITGFTSAGFTLGDDDVVNTNNEDFVAWTFRKAPKFFDVVTYEGNNETAFMVNHNLGVTPGMIILKSVDNSGHWYVWHRGLSSTSHRIRLNNTEAQSSDSNYEIGLNASATQIYIDTGSDINYQGTYIAYLFAHNDGDGEFGPAGDQDIISCGSYEGNGNAAGTVVNLGWEPQWLLIKPVDVSGNWQILDTMRGITNHTHDRALKPSTVQSKENNVTSIDLNATGFSINNTSSDFNTNNSTYIYVAIRSPLFTQTPTAATDVFAISAGGNSPYSFTAGFPVDMAIMSRTNATYPNFTWSRLAGDRISTESAATIIYGSTAFPLDSMTQTGDGWGANEIAYMWKRAKSFFDVVAYVGDDQNNRTVSHNLGVVPEMVWVRCLSDGQGWSVDHKDLTAGHQLNLNGNNGGSETSPAVFGAHTSTVIKYTRGVDPTTNSNGQKYVAYLFATLAGISKVGSVSHSGSSTDVNCGFSNGARFVLLKRFGEGVTGNWYVWDSVRGIVAGNDDYFLLDSTAGEVDSTDYIDPLSSGFQISGSFTDGDYIFYAIA